MKYLAEHEGFGVTSSTALAEMYGLPCETLAKVLQRLADAGLLAAHHGIRGGYTLGVDPHHISVLEVIRASGGECHSSHTLEPDARQHSTVGHAIVATLTDLTIRDIAEYGSSVERPHKSPVSRLTTRFPCQK